MRPLRRSQFAAYWELPTRCWRWRRGGKFEPTGPIENTQLIHFPALPRRMILPIGESNVHRSECGYARLFLAVGMRPPRSGANPQQTFSRVSPIREPDLAGNKLNVVALISPSSSWVSSEYTLTVSAGHIRMLAIIHAGRASLSCHKTSWRQCKC